jgi:hypothetical protein
MRKTLRRLSSDTTPIFYWIRSYGQARNPYGPQIADVRFGSTAELDDTPKAATWAAGIGKKAAGQAANPDPDTPLGI